MYKKREGVSGEKHSGLSACLVLFCDVIEILVFVLPKLLGDTSLFKFVLLHWQYLNSTLIFQTPKCVQKVCGR